MSIGLAGFYSKDAIINATFNAHTGIGTYAFTLLIVSAGMTSFYSWRQFLMTFHGRYRGLDHSHAREAPDTDDHRPSSTLPSWKRMHGSPLTMLVPLGLLATGAVFADMAFAHYFIGDSARAFWRASILCRQSRGKRIAGLGRIGAAHRHSIIGFAIAYYYYILHPELPRKTGGERRGLLYLFLFNKWYFDELYDLIFVRPAFFIGRFLWKKGDGLVIDGLGPDGISARVLDAARGAVKLQSGYVYHYALAMLLGVVALATWFMATGGAL